MSLPRTPIGLLEASNLGQIIGRARYGEEARPASAEVLRLCQRIGKAGQIATLLRKHPGGLRASTIARSLGVHPAAIGSWLSEMPEVMRDSAGVYRLRKEASPP